MTRLRFLVPWALLGAALGSTACRGDDASTTADDFVDRLFVRFDQRSALELADGHARIMLERETRLIGDSRGVGEAELRDQPRVYYDRGTPRRRHGPDGELVVVPYSLTIRSGHSTVARRVEVTVRRRDGRWKVTDYRTSEPR